MVKRASRDSLRRNTEGKKKQFSIKFIIFKNCRVCALNMRVTNLNDILSFLLYIVSLH